MPPTRDSVREAMMSPKTLQVWRALPMPGVYLWDELIDHAALRVKPTRTRRSISNSLSKIKKIGGVVQTSRSATDARGKLRYVFKYDVS